MAGKDNGNSFQIVLTVVPNSFNIIFPFRISPNNPSLRYVHIVTKYAPDDA